MKINVRELIKTLNEIFIKLEINNKSQQINLSNFFEDAKIIFKRLRENRQEIISKMKQPSISCAKKNLSEQKLTNIFKKKRANNIDDRNKYNLVNSCINLDLNDFQNSNQNILTEENGMKKLYGKNTRGKSKPNLFLVDEYSPDMNYLNTLPDFPKNNTQRNILNFNKKEFEIQKLIMQNKKLSMELAKYKSFINDGMNNKNMYNMNNFKKINIFIKDKDKDISQLKQEKYQTNSRYQKEVEAYISGVNYFGNNFKLPLEYYITGAPFINLTVHDVLTTITMFSFSMNNDYDIQILYQFLEKEMGKDFADNVFYYRDKDFPFWNQTIVNDLELMEMYIKETGKIFKLME